MTTKTCFKCGQTKAIAEFYKHSAMADGHLGKCKECAKQDAGSNYKKRRTYYSEYDRKRRQTPRRKLLQSEYQRRRRARNPEKNKAREAVNNAVRDGRLEKKPCEICGEPRSQAHHDDYSKPLDVRWLCLRCHREIAHNQVVTQVDYVQ